MGRDGESDIMIENEEECMTLMRNLEISKKNKTNDKKIVEKENMLNENAVKLVEKNMKRLIDGK